MIKPFFFNILKKSLPVRFKRMLVLSSLYGFIKKNSSEETLSRCADIHKINTILKLAKEENALFIPVSKPYWFWSPEELEVDLVLKNGQALGSLMTLLTTSVIEIAHNTTLLNMVTKYIEAIIPDWLTYGDHAVMRDDIRSLLTGIVETTELANS